MVNYAEDGASSREALNIALEESDLDNILGSHPGTQEDVQGKWDVTRLALDLKKSGTYETFDPVISGTGKILAQDGLAEHMRTVMAG